jgi:S-adenosyl methyltransferase
VRSARLRAGLGAGCHTTFVPCGLDVASTSRSFSGQRSQVRQTPDLSGSRMNELVAEKVTFRTQAEVLRFFDGLDLVEPGLVPVPRWRPASELEASSPTVMWGGIGRKA